MGFGPVCPRRMTCVDGVLLDEPLWLPALCCPACAARLVLPDHPLAATAATEGWLVPVHLVATSSLTAYAPSQCCPVNPALSGGFAPQTLSNSYAVLVSAGVSASSARRTVYTNTTARALITAAAVTPEKRDAAITAAKSYLHKDATLASRQKMLAGTTFAGAYISPLLGYLKPLYVCTVAKVSLADGTSKKRFVLQGANDGRHLQPESAPLDIVANAIFLVEVGATPLPPLWAENAGVPFKKADLADFPEIQALIPDDEPEYQNVVAPRSAPLLFSHRESCRGPIDDTTAGLLDAGLPGLSHWASWMSEWSQEYHDAVLAVYTAQADALGDKFPKLKRHSKPLAGSALATTETVYNDGGAEVDQVLETLRRRLFAVVPAARPPPTDEITTEPEEEVDNDQPPLLTATTRPSGAATTSKAGTIPRKATFRDFSESEQAAAKFLLCNLIYDEATGTVRVPELRDEMDYLFYTLTSSSKKNDQLEDVLNTHIETCDGDVDFLRRLFDPPAFDRAAKALLVNGLLATRNMVDFDTSTGPKDKFRVYMLAADNAATLRIREAARDDRELEELCGEDAANLSKVNVSITHNTQILSADPFMALLANRCGLVEATVVVNLLQWDDVSNPLAYKFSRELALALTTHSARQWLKVTPLSTQRRFFGWLVQMLDMYECLLAQVPSNSRNVFHALTLEFSKISVDPVRKAETLKAEVLTKIIKILSSTENVPTCSLITGLDNKEAKKRLAEKPGTPARPEKQPKTDTTPAPAETDTKGCIIYRKRGIMSTPTIDDPSKRICAAFIRVGVACRRGDKCDMLHNLKPETWPVEAIKAWTEHVEKEPSIRWANTVHKEKLKELAAKATPPSEGA